MRIKTAQRVASSFPKTINPRHALNRLTLMGSYWKRKPVSEAYPQVMNIETTNACNFRCIMCPIDEMKRPTGTMEFSLWKKIVQEAKGKTEMIIPSFFGEPLLNPKIVDFVKYAKDSGIDVHMSTNTSLLTKDKSEALIKAGIDKILICIDGATKEVYEKVRKGGVFEKTIANAEAAMQARDELGGHTVIELQLIELAPTSPEVEKFINKWKNTSADHLKIKKFQNWGGQLNQKSYSHSTAYENAVPCDYLWRVMVIGWNGDVVACCRDVHGKEILGNVNKQSVKEIWNSKRMQELRSLHADGKRESIELCKGCDHYPNKNISATAFFDISTLSKL